MHPITEKDPQPKLPDQPVGGRLQPAAKNHHPLPKCPGRSPNGRAKTHPRALRQLSPPSQKSLPVPVQQIPVSLNPAIPVFPHHERRHRDHPHIPIRQRERRQTTRRPPTPRTQKTRHPEPVLKITQAAFIRSMPMEPMRVRTARTPQERRNAPMRLGPHIAFGSVTGQDDHLHNDLLPSSPPGNEPRTLTSAGGFSAFSLSPAPQTSTPHHPSLASHRRRDLGDPVPQTPWDFTAWDCHPYTTRPLHAKT